MTQGFVFVNIVEPLENIMHLIPCSTLWGTGALMQLVSQLFLIRQMCLFALLIHVCGADLTLHWLLESSAGVVTETCRA